MTEKEILFVCLGNVGRSQMAEAFYNHHSQIQKAISAGILDVAQKFGGHPTPDIIQVMNEKGIDVSQQHIKQITEELVSQVNTVVLLCNVTDEERKQFSFLFSDGLLLLSRVVEDPHKAPIETVRKVRNEVEKIVWQLLADNQEV